MSLKTGTRTRTRTLTRRPAINLGVAPTGIKYVDGALRS
jgi:hypothetical protein